MENKSLVQTGLPLTKKQEVDLLSRVNKEIDACYAWVSLVNDFGKKNVYENRDEKSNLLDNLTRIGRVCTNVINDTNEY